MLEQISGDPNQFAKTSVSIFQVTAAGFEPKK